MRCICDDDDDGCYDENINTNENIDVKHKENVLFEKSDRLKVRDLLVKSKRRDFMREETYDDNNVQESHIRERFMEKSGQKNCTKISKNLTMNYDEMKSDLFGRNKDNILFDEYYKGFNKRSNDIENKWLERYQNNSENFDKNCNVFNEKRRENSDGGGIKKSRRIVNKVRSIESRDGNQQYVATTWSQPEAKNENIFSIKKTFKTKSNFDVEYDLDRKLKEYDMDVVTKQVVMMIQQQKQTKNKGEYLVKLQYFTADLKKENIKDWFVLLEKLSFENNWSEEKVMNIIPLYMKGVAKEIYDEIPSRMKKNYFVLKKELLDKLSFNCLLERQRQQDENDRINVIFSKLIGVLKVLVENLQNQICLKCEKCGSNLHKTNSCKLYRMKCYGCHKKGHLLKTCPETQISVIDKQKLKLNDVTVKNTNLENNYLLSDNILICKDEISANRDKYCENKYDEVEIVGCDAENKKLEQMSNKNELKEGSIRERLSCNNKNRNIRHMSRIGLLNQLYSKSMTSTEYNGNQKQIDAKRNWLLEYLTKKPPDCTKQLMLMNSKLHQMSTKIKQYIQKEE